MSFPLARDSCQNIVPAIEFARDLDRKASHAPNYMFYTPDLFNDGHDTSLETAAAWLDGFLNSLYDKANAEMPWPASTLIVVTFDESLQEEGKEDNHIYTMMLGNMVKRGAKPQETYNHFSVLRTIEENFGLCPLGEGDQFARPITEGWKTDWR